MRIEIAPGVSVRISEDDAALLRRIASQGSIPGNDLAPEEQMLVNILINKQVLRRRNKGKGVIYEIRSGCAF